MELGGAGQRGYVPPAVETEVATLAGSLEDLLPESVRRTESPGLPEIAQPEVYRHFLRLSQETMGAAVGFDTGQGTTTLKYNPPVNERVLRANGIGDLHPLAEESLIQGVLEIIYRLDLALRELSGMARFSLQPGGGTHGIYANACIIRAFHESNGEAQQRDEILTPILSHPGNAAAPRTAGFKVVTLYPGPAGYVEAAAIRAAVSERTAGLMLSNPEDTGIFNPEIEEIIRIVHEAGGLCAHDQANANGLVGIARSVDQGFDLTHYNLHKTFATPHACGGPACGAIGATAQLEQFLPTPLVGSDGTRYFFEDRPNSIGRVRSFHGVLPNVVRAYTWIAAMGGDGLRRMAEASVLNNNYLALRLAQLAGIRPAYWDTNVHPRLEQTRYTLAELATESGVTTDDISRRTGDFGVSGYFPSHHPRVVQEPATLEPTETASRADLDYYAWVIAEVAAEARTSPARVRSAPERAPIHKTDDSWLDDPSRWALTWRAYRRKHGQVVAGDHDGPR